MFYWNFHEGNATYIHVAEFKEISYENVRCNYKFIENTKDAPTEIILPILAK